MKRSKKTTKLLILACVLAVVCFATVGIVRHEEKQEQIQNSDEVILQIPSDTVTALSWDNGTSALSFHKDDKNNTWIYDDDNAFPVSTEKITELLSLFEAFGVAFRIDDVEDPSLYGLDEPVCTIRITTTEQLKDIKTAEELDKAAEPETVTEEASASDPESAADHGPTAESAPPTENGVPTETAANQTAAEAGAQPEGSTYEIRLGDFSTMDAKRYVSIGDGKVYLVSEDPLELFDAGLSDMIAHDDDLSYTSVSAIRFTGKEAYSIVYQEDSANAICSEDVYFTQQGGNTVPLDTDRVGSYLNALTTLDPRNYVNYNVAEDELIDYGLDAPELTVSVDHTKSEEDETSTLDTFILHIGRNRSDVEAANEAAQKAEAEHDEDYIPEAVPAYVRIGDSKIIYEITDEQYRSLMAASYNDLRHQEVFAADFEDVTELIVELEDNTYTLSSVPDEDDEENIVWYFEDNEINVAYLQEALEGLQAYEFTDAAAADKEEISLTVHLNEPNHPEIEIILYRYDGDACLARVNGKVFALVSRSDVVELIEAVHEIVLN